MRALVGVLSLCLCATVAPMAHGSAPATCADGARKERAHETGRLQGISLVEQTWTAVHKDCAQRARVEQAVRDALSKRSVPAGASELMKCRNTGFETGASEALAKIAATCTEN